MYLHRYAGGFQTGFTVLVDGCCLAVFSAFSTFPLTGLASNRCHMFKLSLFCEKPELCSIFRNDFLHCAQSCNVKTHVGDDLCCICQKGNPGKTRYSGSMGNRYMQRIVLPQRVFSLPTSVVGSADYCTNQLVRNSPRGLKQSFVILSFVPLLNCLFDDPSKFAKLQLVIFQLRMS